MSVGALIARASVTGLMFPVSYRACASTVSSICETNCCLVLGNCSMAVTCCCSREVGPRLLPRRAHQFIEREREQLRQRGQHGNGQPGASPFVVNQGRCAAGTWCTQQQCMALRARQSQGPRGGRSWSVGPAHPSVCCARAAAAVRPSRRARSLPPVRPHGAPQSEERKGKKRASHAVQAAMSSCTALLSVEPRWPSRLPFGARCAALTG